jgi:hypothetical protein
LLSEVIAEAHPRGGMARPGSCRLSISNSMRVSASSSCLRQDRSETGVFDIQRFFSCSRGLSSLTVFSSYQAFQASAWCCVFGHRYI